MPDTYVAETRTVLGKAVSRLRREGILPANVYGRGLESTALQIASRDVRTLLHEHGVNTLINLQVSGEAQPRSVVVRKVQRHPVSHQIEHVDFYQVDLSRPIQGAVPIVLVGEAPAVHTHKALLLQGADSVLIEALPAAMPSHVEVSVEGLTELDSLTTVADLQLPEGVTVLTAPEVVLAQISRPRVGGTEAEDELPEGEQEETAEGEGGAEGASAESEAPTEE
jgi:large subunit ribosomal protein L25